jgi:hypothetical protein
MFVNELTRPKIGKDVESTAFDYFNQRKDARGSGEAEADQSVINKLNAMGWKIIGAGVYSMVFENGNKPYILKVNKRQDKGYMAYVSLIKRSRNPHFPKISDQKMLEVIDRFGNQVQYYVYLIEKLQVMPEDEAIDVSYNLEQIILHPYHSLEQIFTNKVHGSIGNMGGKVPNYLLRNRLLVAACQIIGRHIKTFEFRADLKEDNIMERSDGTTVITDPYASITG